MYSRHARQSSRWNDIFCIPEDFLRRYGVDIEPVDTMLTMCVDMDSVL